MYMSLYLRGFTYLLLLSPDKRGPTTNPAATWVHLFFKSPHYQKEVNWLIPTMITKVEPVTVPSMAHTCKPPPEPPPKGWLLFKSSKLLWSNTSNVGGATPFPKSQLYSIQESMRSPSSKFGPVFKSSIMGPKRIKHATVDAPAINVHDDSKYGRPFTLVDKGESTDANEREDPQEGSNIDRNSRKCLVN